jgi:hypothetical protein
MNRPSVSRLSLEPSEAHVVHAASRIYAAYIVAGKVTDGQEAYWIQKSIEEAHHLAKVTDRLVVADTEMG